MESDRKTFCNQNGDILCAVLFCACVWFFGLFLFCSLCCGSNFTERKSVLRNKSCSSGLAGLDAWLAALGSQAVYGRVDSLIPTADGHVIGVGGCRQKPITSER